MMILYNGKIYSKGGFCQALLIDGKNIVATGSNEEIRAMAGHGDKYIDLEGRLVLPGFVDTHAHGPLSFEQKSNIDLYADETKEEYLKTVEDFVKAHPDKRMYSGMGWLNPAFDALGPDKESLDRICDDRPVILRSGDGHSVWANSKAIEMAGITDETPDPDGGTIERNEDGSTHGTFRDQAQEIMLALIPEPTVEEFLEAIEGFQDMMVSYGHTAVFDPLVAFDGNLNKAYRRMNEEGRLKMKFALAYSSMPEDPEGSLEGYRKGRPLKNGKLTEGTFVKVFIDGVVEGGTACLKEDYCNQEGYCGRPLWSQDTLNDFCAEVDRLGYDLHFHVIGDAAVQQVIEAMEYVKQENGSRARNTVAAHMQIVDPADYDKLKELDIRVSSNPYWFVKAPGYYEDIELPFLGKRAETEYPMKSFFDMGLVVSAGSDYAVTPRPYPMEGIQLAMLRTLPEEDYLDPEKVLGAAEKITLEQGLDAFTLNGAVTMGISDVTGSLEAGKCADIVVMEQDVFQTAPEKLFETNVYMTISDGEIVYEKDGRK